jgi:hypothetical protein
MAVPSPLSPRLTVAALLTLTAVTGLVDAVSYLRLGHVFVANMTGNVVFLGFTVYPHSGLSLAASLTAIGGFVVGALAGGRVAHTLAAARPRRWLVVAFTAEAVILGAVAVLTATTVLGYAGNSRYATIALLAVALGVQNSTVRHLGVADLSTAGWPASRRWPAGAAGTEVRDDSGLHGGHAGALPLIRRCWPLTKPARSLARYAAALATSSSVPIRAIGRNERTNSRTWSVAPLMKTPPPSLAVGRIEGRLGLYRQMSDVDIVDGLAIGIEERPLSRRRIFWSSHWLAETAPEASQILRRQERVRTALPARSGRPELLTALA